MRTEIILPITSLERERWVFYTFGRGGTLVMVVDTYAYETRPSPRHKFKPKTSYTRIGSARYAPQEPPPLTQAVKDEARAALNQSLQIVATLD